MRSWAKAAGPGKKHTMKGNHSHHELDRRRIIRRRVYHALALSVSIFPLLAQQPPLPLGDLPAGRRFLIVQSHHDDHTWEWGFGGFAAKLVEAGWTGSFVRTTNDEKDGGVMWGENDQVNHRESREATRALGLQDVISLNWRNDHMDSVPIKEVRAHFILLLRKVRPDVVMTWDPWGHYDRNPDHRKVARAMGEALWLSGLASVHPEHAELGLTPYRVPRVYYTFRSDYGRGHAYNVAIELNESQMRKKQEAYWAHKNVRNNPGQAKAIRAALAARGLEIPELKGLSDGEAIERLMKLEIEFASRETTPNLGFTWVERFWMVDEFDSLPGLKVYLQDNVVRK